METNSEYHKKIIKDIIKKHPNNYEKVLRNHYNDTYIWILEKTKKIPLNPYYFSTKCYWALNDITDFPICPVCSHVMSDRYSINVLKGYPKRCSIACMNKDKQHVENVKSTCRKRFNSESPQGSKEVHDKSVKTRYKHNGEGKYYSEESIEKKKQTNIEKYGDPNYNNREQFISTCIERYNVRNPLQCKEIKEKQENTMEKVYGKRFALQLNKFIQKAKETCIKQFGIDSYSKTLMFKKSIVKFLGKKYLYNNVMFDSGWELVFYIWLKDHNISFDYHGDDMVIEYKTSDKNTHHYFPDFKINGQYYEIKGDHFFKDKETSNSTMINPFTKEETSKEKVECIKKNSIILTWKDIAPLYKEIESKYGKNYIKQFRRMQNA